MLDYQAAEEARGAGAYPEGKGLLGCVLAPSPPTTLTIDGQRLGYVSATALVRLLGVGTRCPHPNATTTTASTPRSVGAAANRATPSCAGSLGTNGERRRDGIVTDRWRVESSGPIAVIGRGVLPERYRRQNRIGRPARTRGAGAGPARCPTTLHSLSAPLPSRTRRATSEAHARRRTPQQPLDRGPPAGQRARRWRRARAP